MKESCTFAHFQFDKWEVIFTKSDPGWDFQVKHSELSVSEIYSLPNHLFRNENSALLILDMYFENICYCSGRSDASGSNLNPFEKDTIAYSKYEEGYNDGAFP